jgi:hypothetical protein
MEEERSVGPDAGLGEKRNKASRCQRLMSLPHGYIKPAFIKTDRD